MFQSAEVLKQRGIGLLNQPRSFIQFTDIQAANQLLNDIDCQPHAFVLACLMDQQVRAERAWRIPYQIGVAVGDFAVSLLLKVGEARLTQIFEKEGLHRFNPKMAKVFYLGLERIQTVYGGNAANIWLDQPSSARVVRRFLEFHGVGIKIATMATNILARDFKVPMADHAAIDVSPDVHVRRVFERLGYVRSNADYAEIIYTARELNPSYPGVFDLSVWEVGRRWCKPSNPSCDECYLSIHCPKIGVNESHS